MPDRHVFEDERSDDGSHRRSAAYLNRDGALVIEIHDLGPVVEAAFGMSEYESLETLLRRGGRRAHRLRVGCVPARRTLPRGHYGPRRLGLGSMVASSGTLGLVPGCLAESPCRSRISDRSP